MRYYLLLGLLMFSFSNFAMHEQSKELMDLIEINQYEKIKFYLLGFNEEELDKILNDDGFILYKAMINPRVGDNVIELLLQSGADPNMALYSHWKRNKHMQGVLYRGSNAAHAAVLTKRSLWLFDVLRGFNTDFKQKDASGWTALDLAKSYKMEALIEYFKRHGIAENKTDKN